MKHFDAYKAVVVYDLIAVLVHKKSVPFLSCHPVVEKIINEKNILN